MPNLPSRELAPLARKEARSLDMKPLLVVPIRAGSHGLPGKHLRLLGGMPVAERVLTMLQTIPDIVLIVSTNDPAVRDLCLRLHVRWLDRPVALCAPDITLDPVIHHAWELWDAPAIVASVQATAPFLRRETVLAALRAVMSEDHDTATVVVDDRHLRWEGTMPPARVNRQQMPPAWRETAAVCATRGAFVTPTNRFGPRVKLIEVSGAEAVDLDTPDDWAVAEWYAGVPSNRECLMARVLGEQEERGEAVLLSGWDEPMEDWQLRTSHAIDCAVITPLIGANTHAEAQAFFAMRAPPDVTIVTSAYHQVRAFLTFLRVLEEQGFARTVRLWNAAAPSRMEPLAEEWQKIAEYQAIGHVASYEAGIEYLNWRDSAVPVPA